jgi:hypothetical protein
MRLKTGRASGEKEAEVKGLLPCNVLRPWVSVVVLLLFSECSRRLRPGRWEA